MLTLLIKCNVQGVLRSPKAPSTQDIRSKTLLLGAGGVKGQGKGQRVGNRPK